MLQISNINNFFINLNKYIYIYIYEFFLNNWFKIIFTIKTKKLFFLFVVEVKFFLAAETIGKF